MKVMRIRKWITLYFRILPLVLAAQLDSLRKRLIPIKMCRRGAIACFAPVGQEMYKDFCYTSQLKYVFRLEEHVVTCRGLKLANSLGKQQLELSTRTWSGRAISLKPRQIYGPAGVKQTVSSQFFSSFESGGITKYLMTGHAGNSEVCFPSTSMFPSANIEGRGKKTQFPLGPVINYAYAYVACVMLIAQVWTRL